MATANKTVSAGYRLLVAALVGLAAGLFVATQGSWKVAPLAGWDSAAVVYIGWAFMSTLRMNAAQTKAHAVRENPGRALADVLLVVASIASLVAVGFLILQASNATGGLKALEVSLGLVSVVVSWAVVHTTYALKYARLYYGNTEGGIDFNQTDPPRYLDFAYLAFTVGMTFQVSDTDLKTKEIRTTVLKHALLSFLFGTVIIATTINTLASLSK